MSIPTGGEIGLLTFSGTGGQLATIEFTNDTFSGCGTQEVTVLNPDGTTLYSNQYCGGNITIDGLSLMSTGTYTIEFTALGTATGSADVSLLLFNNQTGTVTPGTPTVINLNTPGQSDLLTFSGTAGQLATIEFTNDTLSGCYAQTVTVLNPDGSTLYSDQYCTGNITIDALSLPTTGTYTIELTAVGTSTGSADLSLWLFSNQTGSVTPGTPVAININTPGQSDLLTFSGTAGQLATIEFTSDTFNGCYAQAVTVLNPDGSMLYSDQYCTGNITIDALSLPTTGTYTIELTAVGTSTGSADLSLWLFSNQTGSVTPGTPTVINLNTPGQSDLLTFSGTAGQLATIEFTSDTFSGCLPQTVTVLNPNGSRLYNSEYCGGNITIDALSLPTTGTYTIEFTAAGTATGSADLSLWLFSNQTGTVTPGTPTAVNISTPGQSDLLTFSGTAGQLASIEFTNDTFAASCFSEMVTVHNPDGSTLHNSEYCGGNITIDALSLPTTGTYTIELTAGGTATGSADLSLWLFSNQTGTVTPGTPTAINISTPGQSDLLTFSGTAGQLASIEFTNDTFAASCFSEMVTVHNPDGSTLYSGEYCGGDITINSLSLSTTGTYTIEFTAGGTATGSADLSLTLSGT